MVLIAFQLL